MTARQTLQLILQNAPDPVAVFNRKTGEPIFHNKLAREEWTTKGLRNLWARLPKQKLKNRSWVHESLPPHRDIYVQILKVKSLSLCCLTFRKPSPKTVRLIKDNTRLYSLDKAKDRFIATTTHELRSPLSAMVSAAEILKDGIFDTPEEHKKFAEMIYEQGLHLQELVDDILDFSKVKAGRMDLYVEKRDLTPLLNEVAQSFQAFSEGRHIRIEVQPDAHLPLCYFDEMRLRQVLGNLVNNAIKYNFDGGLVRITAHAAAKMVQVCIQDTGPGIASENFKSIFNEFETLGNLENHHKGTGLGLPISKRLIEAMGGIIDVSSKLGQGSTFWIEIPTQQVLEDSVYRPRPLAA